MNKQINFIEKKTHGLKYCVNTKEIENRSCQFLSINISSYS